MKKLLSLSLASLAFAAVADITVGVTAISTTTKNTIVPVPYSKIGTNTAIAPKELVKAKNLPNGTMLYVFNGTSYYAWRQDGGAWVIPDYASTEKISGVTVETTDSCTLAKGSALWVVLPEASNQTIYVYGDGVSPATSSTVAAGGENGVATLVANPLQGEANITVTPRAGDQIIIPNTETMYTYRTKKDGSAGTWRYDGAAATLPSFDVGQGFWYVRAAGGSATEITWALKQQ